MADALKFGPQWLRNLSGSSSVTSPPTSPSVAGAMNSVVKLSNHRYGREEMLALYTGSYTEPPSVNPALGILSKRAMAPLSLEDPAEDDLLYGSGSAGMKNLGHVAPHGRGMRGMDRGRGRGRGRGGDGSYYQRGSSYDEDGGYVRKPGRGDAWEEVRDKPFGRGYNPRYNEDDALSGPGGPRKEYGRSMSGDNWRHSGVDGERGEHHYRKKDGPEEDEDGGDWRRIPPGHQQSRWANRGGFSGSGRTNWRDRAKDSEQMLHFNDYRDRPNYNRERSYSKSKLNGAYEEDGEQPEWDIDDDETVGTFDSSGAFVAMKDAKGYDENGRFLKSTAKSKKHDAENEQFHSAENDSGDHSKVRPNSVHLDSEVTDPGADRSQRAGSEPNFPARHQPDGHAARNSKSTSSSNNAKSDHSDHISSSGGGVYGSDDVHTSNNAVINKQLSQDTQPLDTSNGGARGASVPQGVETFGNDPKPTLELATQCNIGVKPSLQTVQAADSSGLVQNVTSTAIEAASKEDNEFEYLEKAAENLVAEWTADEEVQKPVPSPVTVDQNTFKWFYKDPQGQVQGPFKGSEMMEWFTAGYFTGSLLVKRGCDEIFQQLGDLKNRFGKVPFVNSDDQQPPPFKADPQPAAAAQPVSLAPSTSSGQHNPMMQHLAALGVGGIEPALGGVATRSTAVPTAPINPASLAGLTNAGDGGRSVAGVLGGGGGSLAGMAAPSMLPPSGVGPTLPGSVGGQPLSATPGISIEENLKLLHEQQLHMQQQQLLLVQYQKILQALNQQPGFHNLPQDHQRKLALQLMAKQPSFALQQQQQLQIAQQAMAQHVARSGITPEQQVAQQVSAQQQQQVAQHPAVLQRSLSTQVSDQPSQVQPTIAAPASSGQQVPPPQFTRSLSTPGSDANCQPGETTDAAFWNKENAHPMQQKQPWSHATTTINNSAARPQPTQATQGSVWDLDSKAGPTLQEIKEMELKKLQEENQRKLDIHVQKQREMKLAQQEKEKAELVAQERQREIERAKQQAQRLEEAKIRAEQERIRQEQERIQEEERRQKEEMLRQEEERRKMEEERRRIEEERRKQQEEKARQEQLRKEEEERARIEAEQAAAAREREEAEKRRVEEMQKRMEKAEELKKQQKQLANMQLPSTAQWARGNNGTNQPSMSLEEIQQKELEQQRRDEALRAEQRRQQVAAIQAQQQQQQQTTWAKQTSKNGATGQSKTLKEIQAEQAKQLELEKQQQAKAKQQAPAAAAAPAPAWSGQSQNHWASSGPWGSKANSSATGGGVSGGGGGGFWDEPAATTPVQSSPKKGKKQKQNNNNNTQFPSLPGAANNQTKSSRAKSSKSKKDEEVAQRIFKDAKPQDQFTLWCEKALKNMESSLDVPTFVAFLKDVESPYEVQDYVRSYLGDSKEANNFAKAFLEKRSSKNPFVDADVEEEDTWMTTSKSSRKHQNAASSHDHQDRSGAGGAGAKKNRKKQKKLDGSSLLGFTVHAAPDRINAGGIESIE